jgi:hypothetical protein
MVLQVAPDLRRIMYHRDAVLVKMIRRPDARQHQQLRRVDRAAAEDHFTLCPDRFAHTLADDLDALCPAALDDDPRRDRLRQQVEIAAPPPRLSESHCHAGAAAVCDVGVDPAKTLDGISVEIVDDRASRLTGSCEERIADQQIDTRLLDRHRAVGAMPLAGTAAVALGFLEVGQHLVERPSLAAALGPLLVFERVAAQVQHAVDAARPAEYAALKPR